MGLGEVAEEADPGSLCWEIGSITKVFTGILLAEMTRTGEVALDDPIGRHAPEDVAARLPDDQPRLVDLATHTAGLPRVPAAWLRRIKKHQDPYSLITEQDVWEVLDGNTDRPSKARSRYSNYGMGLLGHLLARRAGAMYADTIRERVLEPLGLHHTGVAVCDPVPGVRKPGRPTPPWTFGALEGAGALRSTIDDMLTFATAVIDPPTPAWHETMRLALDIHHSGRFTRMGLGWQIRRLPGVDDAAATRWHNGGTYGAASFLGIDVAGRRAIVAFGNRGPRLSSPIDRTAWKAFDS